MHTRKSSGSGCQTDSKIQERSHPLHNYVVLKEVMSYLQLPDLKNCRLVHKKWTQSATPILQKKSTLIVYSALCDVWTMRSGRTVDRRLREVGELGMESCTVDLSDLALNLSARQLVLKFLEGNGGNFKHLNVSIAHNTMDLFGTILSCFPNLVGLEIKINPHWNVTIEQLTKFSTLFWWLSTLPSRMTSLVFLDIRVDPVLWTWRGCICMRNFVYFIHRIFRMAPNLETLKLSNCPRTHRPYFTGGSQNIFLMMLKYRQRFSLPRIKDLIVGYDHSEFSIGDIKMLLAMDINLRQLELPGFCAGDQLMATEYIIQLIEQHRATVEVLQFQIPAIFRNNAASQVTFPTCPKLKKLVIKLYLRNINEIPSMSFQPLVYETQLPALRELHLRIYFLQPRPKVQRFDRQIQLYNQFFPDDGQVCSSLRVLEVKVPHPTTRGLPKAAAPLRKITWRLEKMFPNVQNHKEINICRAMYV